jgi:acetyl-CoA carboxylase carboxyl transferase subunit alpha
MDVVLEFERPVVELRRRIDQLRTLQETDGVDLSASISDLENQATRLESRIFGSLTRWQRTLLARHPARPYALDFIDNLFLEWTEMHGDRAGYDDRAIVSGMARFRPTGDALDDTTVAVIAHQKGRNTKEKLYRNFGMARPDGYRKAMRVMKLAERFNIPIITLIDTPGAYPGVDAEERGQAEAIARSIMDMSRLKVPVITVVIGEGGSGGALAIGVANKVLMLENAVYSVISPEGCAAILWRDRAEGPRAAEALKITAMDCVELGVADGVIPEPVGGAHRSHAEIFANVAAAVRKEMLVLKDVSKEGLREERYARFRAMGRLTERATT